MATDTALDHLRLAAEVAGVEASNLALPRSEHLIANGLRLHYLDWGGDGPPLLFLHGGALTAHSWDLVCLALRDDYRCLALDARGHGDSEWSPTLEYEPRHHAQDVAAFADALERPVLVGQSMGGLSALTYAAAGGAERVRALVLVDVAPSVSDTGSQRIADFVLGPAELDSLDEFVERARAFNPARDERLLRRSLLHNLRRLPNGRWTWKYDRRHLSQESFERLRASLPRLVEQLPKVTCPVLVVRGAGSDVLSESGAAQFAADLPDGRAVTVPGAGHTVQGDNPRGLAAALREFVTDA
jgi:esterase